jgi:hypothetical protein
MVALASLTVMFGVGGPAPLVLRMAAPPPVVVIVVVIVIIVVVVVVVAVVMAPLAVRVSRVLVRAVRAGADLVIEREDLLDRVRLQVVAAFLRRRPLAVLESLFPGQQ